MNKFVCFWSGLKIAWGEKVFKVWLGICIVGILVGLWSGVGMTQLVLLVAVACMGWALEIANTGVERMMDFICPEYNINVKVVKDLFCCVPAFLYSAYVISWMILVLPYVIRRLA